MAESEHHAIARRLYDDFNARDLDAIGRACADDVTLTDMATGQTFEGPAGFRAVSERWIAAFPDASLEVLHQVAAGDFVIIEFIGRGTHRGPLRDATGHAIAPTGQHVELSFCKVLRLRDGRIATARLYYDALTLLRQLVAIAVAEPPAAAP